MPIDPSILKPGDAILYAPSSVFGYLIAAKTFNRVSHIEVFADNGFSFASRDGKGVDQYPLRTAQAMHVMRPNGPFDFQKACNWFYAVAKGQKYDLKAICVFLLLASHGDDGKMICSEFATNFYRAGGFEPFQPDYAADKVPPSYFLSAGTFTEVWKDE